MAITGLLVHSVIEDAQDVEKSINELEGMTTYGIHQDQYVVVVVEAPSDRIERVVGQIDDIEGVLSVYTTYLTIEDEIDTEGNLQTNLSLKEMCKKPPVSKMH